MEILIGTYLVIGLIIVLTLHMIARKKKVKHPDVVVYLWLPILWFPIFVIIFIITLVENILRWLARGFK